MWKKWAGVIAMVVTVGCAPPSDPPSDDGWTTDLHDTNDGGQGDLGLRLGESSDDRKSYTPYADTGAEVELIRGFQGGYHLEPAVYLTGGPPEGFEADIYYDVRRTSNDEQINRRRQYTIGPEGWLGYREGWLHHSNPVILAISRAEDVVGDEVRLEVRVDIHEGGEVTATQTATVVDGGRPL